MSSQNQDRPLKVAEDIKKKWGTSINHGWTAVPNDLLRYQSTLGLDAMDLNILLNLLRFWWHEEKPPFPSAQKTANEMGVNKRTIYRRLTSLEQRGFLEFQTIKNRSGDDIRAYSLKKLADKLDSIRYQDKI